MTSNDAMKHIPREGFVKLSGDAVPTMSGEQRAALIRKGNELFNGGRIEQAKRVFLTVRYGDGLSRLGDYYFEHDEHLEALRMYWIAPAPDKVEKLIEKMASVVQKWLTEEEGSNEKRGTDQHIARH